MMKSHRRFRWYLPLIALIGVGMAAFLLYNRGRPLPVPLREKLYPEVVYSRRVRLRPRPMVIHVLTVDVRTKKVHFLVTPPDEPGSDLPLLARTTSEFLQESGVQVAVNGDGFSPWWSNSPVDYYPHAGDPVAPRGDAASLGEVYWTSEKTVPTLYISSTNQLSFDGPARPYNALSGESPLVEGGRPVDDLNDVQIHPRTAIGYSKNGKFLYIVVVDGRQPFYSEGMTLAELAELMTDIGAQFAMNLDGGGSSTLVVRGPDDRIRVLNSPIDLYIPGRQRPVANHLGIFVER
jgi:hypothetical protein